jgi:hypothetical protein
MKVGESVEGLTKCERFALRLPQMLPLMILTIFMGFRDMIQPSYQTFILVLIVILMIGHCAYLHSIHNKLEALQSQQQKGTEA